jgi:tyrosyl-tRNA synthetase
MTVVTDEKKIDELLTRGVAEVIDQSDLREKLLSGRKLTVKLGVDPTSPHLHLGRTVPLLKLKDFYDLGHRIVFLVGNATGVIGDTSDKEAERPMLSHEDIEENMRLYTEQVARIIETDDFDVVYNADWLNSLGYKEIGHHADAFSLHEFIQRDNIKKRLDAGKRVSLRELLYPLMQGYDSVALEADVELGGTDQRFNLLAGRVLQEQAGQERQNVVMTNLILGTDGRKMSSSWGNTITPMDTPRDMGEKIMNMPDDITRMYFEHCTRLPMDEVENVMCNAEPRYSKIILAGVLLTFYYGEEVACQEKNNLEKKFITKDISSMEIAEYSAKEQEAILDLLVGSGSAASKGDARRKIQQGGVSLDGEKVLDTTYVLASGDNGKVLKVGKKFFVKIVL